MKLAIIFPLFTASTLAAPTPQGLFSGLGALFGVRGGAAGGATRNDIQDGKCAPTTIVYARGTSEPGNVGAIAGPPFFTALQAIMGNNIAVQGVNNYPADVAGFIAGGSDTGAKFMADIVQQAVTSCNSTKIVMAGYSQGAQVVHKAAAQLSTTAQSKVMAIVTFGDPDNGQAFPGVLNGREKSICRNGDLICKGLAIVQAAHLQYGQDAQAAAQFVQAQTATA